MRIFCQQNYPQKLGTSNFTISRYGCLLTSITMAYDWFKGVAIEPPEIDYNLSFTQDGYLVWSSLENIGLRLVKRVQGRDDSVIKEALSNPNECCVIQVNNSHWVLLMGRYIPFLGYKIADPWFGDISYTKRYKNNITGCAIISKV